jgi:branched-chain amino acid aminotransferase
VTRDSILTLARDLGYAVSERVFDVAEMLDWVKTGEAALSGTAAVLAGVGTLIYRGKEHRRRRRRGGPADARALRAQLVSIQQGESADPHGWLERV